MTSHVKVTAHCGNEKQVCINMKNAGGTENQCVIIRDGETYAVSVWDDWSVSVCEQLRPVLTDADFAGAPRPARD